MATSGTYADAQTNDSIIVEAYERIGKDVEQLNGGHARTAMRSLTFMFSDWDNRGIKQWTVDQQTLSLTQSDVDYTLPDGTLDVLDVSLRRSGVDTPIALMSRTEYNNLNDKTVEGRPDRVFIQRNRDSVTMYVYYAPENSTDEIVYWRIRSLQDVGDPTANPDVPRRWWDAIAAGLAERLHMKIPAGERDSMWANVLTVLKARADDSLYNAMTEDRERADLGVYPEGWAQ